MSKWKKTTAMPALLARLHEVTTRLQRDAVLKQLARTQAIAAALTEPKKR